MAGANHPIWDPLVLGGYSPYKSRLVFGWSYRSIGVVRGFARVLYSEPPLHSHAHLSLSFYDWILATLFYRLSTSCTIPHACLAVMEKEGGICSVIMFVCFCVVLGIIHSALVLIYLTSYRRKLSSQCMCMDVYVSGQISRVV